jgi:hypothetical protein
MAADGTKKTAENSEITAGAGQGPTRWESSDTPIHIGLATIADKSNLSINYCYLPIS